MLAPSVDAAPYAADLARRGPSTWMRFLRQPRTYLAGGFVLLLVLIAVGAPLVSPKNPDFPYPNGLSLIGAPLPPLSPGFPLGTDGLGRDVLSRLIWGSRLALEVGVGSSAVALVGGTLAGMMAGFFKGAADIAIMRWVDMMLAFPFVLFVIFVAAVFGSSVPIILIAIGVLQMAPIARLARAKTLEVSAMAYVEAATASGASRSRILIRHAVPNLVTTVLPYALLQVGTNITLESALSYLGAGPPPPTPDWGAMVSEGQQGLATAPWLFFFPGLCIMLTVVAFNLLADSWLTATRAAR
jgi:ABC-type dipeptide/oligopeptide/nickel transport system permease subunit